MSISFSFHLKPNHKALVHLMSTISFANGERYGIRSQKRGKEDSRSDSERGDYRKQEGFESTWKRRLHLTCFVESTRAVLDLMGKKVSA